MLSSVLYFFYGAVMTAGLVCFIRAYQTRLDTPVHRRWGLTGTAISLTGILVVLVNTYAWGWRLEERWPVVIKVHRGFALAAMALLLLTAITGLARHRIHPRLYVLFLPVYILALLTAALGYGP